MLNPASRVATRKQMRRSVVEYQIRGMNDPLATDLEETLCARPIYNKLCYKCVFSEWTGPSASLPGRRSYRGDFSVADGGEFNWETLLVQQSSMLSRGNKYHYCYGFNQLPRVMIVICHWIKLLGAIPSTSAPHLVITAMQLGA